MARYFFTLRGSDREKIANDVDSADLPDIAAALVRAERAISELKSAVECRNSTLMLLVQNETRHTVLYLPLLPACA